MLRVILALFLVAGVSVASWAEDITYRKNIRPLWEQKCAACHGAGSPCLGEFMLNSSAIYNIGTFALPSALWVAAFIFWSPSLVEKATGG